MIKIGHCPHCGAIMFITEQEEEIERLKAQQREIDQLKYDYAKLQELFAQYQMASEKEIKAQVKQAKIDVLNELKEKRKTVFIDTDDIDELIKRIKK